MFKDCVSFNFLPVHITRCQYLQAAAGELLCERLERGQFGQVGPRTEGKEEELRSEPAR